MKWILGFPSLVRSYLSFMGCNMYVASSIHMNPFTGGILRFFIADRFDGPSVEGRYYNYNEKENKYVAEDHVMVPVADFISGFDYVYHGELNDTMSNEKMFLNQTGRG